MSIPSTRYVIKQEKGIQSAHVVRHGNLHGYPNIIVIIFITLIFMIYLPHLATKYNGIDLPAYSKVLFTNNALQTACDLFSDLHGRIVYGYYAPLSSVTFLMQRIFVFANQAWLAVFINLILHLTNGWIFYKILNRLQLDSSIILISTLIFLIHPVQVSSIQWFAERKTVLSTFFMFGSFYEYLAFRNNENISKYIFSVFLYLAALLSKPSVVIYPFWLLATEVMLNASGNNSGSAHKNWKIILISVSPFIIMAFLFGLLTIVTEPTEHDLFPHAIRPFVASYSLMFYAEHLIFPFKMAFFYPKWDININTVTPWIVLLTTVNLILVMGVIIIQSILRKSKSNSTYYIFIWALTISLISLFPTIGLLNFGYLRYSYVADHFAYLAVAGFSVIVAVGFNYSANLVTAAKPLIVTLLLIYTVFLGTQTWFTAQTWRTNDSLWMHNIQKFPQSWHAETCLGQHLSEKDELASALAHLKRAIELNPNYYKAYNDMGAVLLKIGNYEEAEAAFIRANKLNPRYASTLINLAILQKSKGNRDEAKSLLNQARSISPDQMENYINLGRMYEDESNFSSAIIEYQQANKLAPNNSIVHFNYGNVFAKIGHLDQAIAHYYEALELNPSHLDTLLNLGIVLYNANQFEAASKYLNKALELDPANQKAKKILDIMTTVP